MSLSDIPVALEALRQGRPVIVADDESRENEGDIVIAAQSATREGLAFMIRHTSGFICAPMTNEIANRLELPYMVTDNQTRCRRRTRSPWMPPTASPPASAPATGLTPSGFWPAWSQAPRVSPAPGTSCPCGPWTAACASGRATRRRRSTFKLAGLIPVGAIGEIVRDDGDMMRLPELITFGELTETPVVTITALIEYLQEWHCDSDVPVAVEIPESKRVDFEVETIIPTIHGSFRVRAYRDRKSGADHLAIISGTPTNGTLVRVHSECLTGEV